MVILSAFDLPVARTLLHCPLEAPEAAPMALEALPARRVDRIRPG